MNNLIQLLASLFFLVLLTCATTFSAEVVIVTSFPKDLSTPIKQNLKQTPRHKTGFSFQENIGCSYIYPRDCYETEFRYLLGECR